MSPHERFIVGQGESGRLYVTHTRWPRFVGELFADDDADLDDGLSLALPLSGEVLANFDWIDDPAECDLQSLRRDVEAFIEESDFRGEREIGGSDD